MSGFMDQHNKKDFNFVPSVAEVEAASAEEQDGDVQVNIVNGPSLPASTAGTRTPIEVPPTLRKSQKTSEPAPKPITTIQPAFTEVNIKGYGAEFAGEWRPTMETPDYIGSNSLILDYLYGMERHHHVTMPIRACGIDPIVFEYVNIFGVDEDDNDDQTDASDRPRMFDIPNNPLSEAEEDTGSRAAYELIKVDGELYLSCVNECLDPAYLKSVLAEATASVKSRGEYIYEMVGFRRIMFGDPETGSGQLLNTLKLNTYEMSVLVTYMLQFPGLKYSYVISNDKQCIYFKQDR